MKTSKGLMAILAATLCACGLIISTTRAVESSQRPFRGALLERAKEKLGLTDDQVGKIKAEIQADKATITDLVLKLHEARIALRDAIQDSNGSEAAVRAAAAKSAAVQADMAVERRRLHGKISPILTPEQREKVKEFQSRIDDALDAAINRLGERLAR